MPARKTAKKKEPKALSRKEYDKLMGFIGKARVMCYKISNNKDYRADVRRAMGSIEKKLWNLGNDYYWGSLTDYKN